MKTNYQEHSDDAIPTEVAEISAAADDIGPGPGAKGNGHDPNAPAGNGIDSLAATRNPFAVVDDDAGDGADDSWRDQLPSGDQVRDNVYSLWDDTGIAALGRLKAADRPAYERQLDVLSKLFPAPRTVREELGRAVDKASRARERESQTDFDSTAADAVGLMLESAQQHGRLFIDPMRQAYLDYRDPKTRVLAARPMRHPDVQHMLTLAAFDKTGRAPSDDAVATAVRTLEALARRTGEIVPVFPRVGWHEGVLYIDRAASDGSVIRVDRSGTNVIDLTACPVRFLYDVAKGELPVPDSGGSLDPLWDILKLRSDRDRKLTLGHLVGCFAPHGPYAGLAIYGLYGSSKTFTMWALGELIDPSNVDPGMMSESEQNTLIMLQRILLVRFDNMSHLSPDQSNTLCRVAQGGSFRTRLLYSASEEIILQAERPIIVNGIAEIISQPDLADRFRCITLDRIPPEDRKQRQELRDKFIAARPAIFGALLNAVAAGLSRTDYTPPRSLPRMADHVVWVSRCELGLGFSAGDYLRAYNANSTDAAQAIVDADALAEQIEAFAAARAGLGWSDDEWKGTATALLKELDVQVGAAASRQPGWPKSANRLSARLKRLQPTLEEIGIEAVLGDSIRTEKSRDIHLRCDPRRFPPPGTSGKAPKVSSSSSGSSATPENPKKTQVNLSISSSEPHDDTSAPRDDPDDPPHRDQKVSSCREVSQSVENTQGNHPHDDPDDHDDTSGGFFPGGGKERRAPKVRREYR